MLASVLEFSRWVFGNRRVRVRGGIDTEFDSVAFGGATEHFNVAGRFARHPDLPTKRVNTSPASNAPFRSTAFLYFPYQARLACATKSRDKCAYETRPSAAPENVTHRTPVILRACRRPLTNADSRRYKQSRTPPASFYSLHHLLFVFARCKG